MGDRANVYVHDGDKPGVYLYTHWTGSDLPSIVYLSLSSKRGQARDNDIAYLTRIVFEDMLSESLGSETGFGISTEIQDGGDRIVDLDVNFNYGWIMTLIGYEEDYPDSVVYAGMWHR
jgi:hypothetical protein